MFAARLDQLFHHIRHPTGRQYSLREVADGINEAGKVSITPSHLSRLRSGASRNPGFDQITAIAAFFGVDPKYFLEGDQVATRTSAELQLLAAMRQRGIEDLLLRATNLSTEGLDVLRSTIEGLESREALRAKDPLRRRRPREHSAQANSPGVAEEPSAAEGADEEVEQP
ncbi:helix-turn-helix domain-containing protein [Kineococcus gypseus]|uniref:helix-turn-helix domain-containing protein n=1 Tax=Kineococcus gypseus TaxID=1637102 RepID=UPI003D7CC88A